MTDISLERKYEWAIHCIATLREMVGELERAQEEADTEKENLVQLWLKWVDANSVWERNHCVGREDDLAAHQAWLEFGDAMDSFAGVDSEEE